MRQPQEKQVILQGLLGARALQAQKNLRKEPGPGKKLQFVLNCTTPGAPAKAPPSRVPGINNYPRSPPPPSGIALLYDERKGRIRAEGKSPPRLQRAPPPLIPRAFSYPKSGDTGACLPGGAEKPNQAAAAPAADRA